MATTFASCRSEKDVVALELKFFTETIRRGGQRIADQRLSSGGSTGCMASYRELEFVAGRFARLLLQGGRKGSSPGSSGSSPGSTGIVWDRSGFGRPASGPWERRQLQGSDSHGPDLFAGRVQTSNAAAMVVFLSRDSRDVIMPDKQCEENGDSQDELHRAARLCFWLSVWGGRRTVVSMGIIRGILTPPRPMTRKLLKSVPRRMAQRSWRTDERSIKPPCNSARALTMSSGSVVICTVPAVVPVAVMGFRWKEVLALDEDVAARASRGVGADEAVVEQDEHRVDRDIAAGAQPRRRHDAAVVENEVVARGNHDVATSRPRRRGDRRAIVQLDVMTGAE